MILKIEGFKEMLDILKDLFSGVKTAVQVPENNKKEMKEALAATAELIDQTLSILKQQLTNVLSELKFGDGNRQNVRRMIFELGNYAGWEEKYRQFQMCDKLREATYNLDRKGLYKVLHNLSFNDADQIQEKMWKYLGGEASAAISVATMLTDLSMLENKVETEYDLVIDSLELARNEVGAWRQVFIDFEKEIRNSMA